MAKAKKGGAKKGGAKRGGAKKGGAKKGKRRGHSYAQNYGVESVSLDRGEEGVAISAGSKFQGSWKKGGSIKVPEGGKVMVRKTVDRKLKAINYAARQNKSAR